MCDPSKCFELERGEGLDDDYLKCVESADGIRALTCKCTQLVWECLRNSKKGNCKIADRDHPVDEAGSWCRKFVVHQGIGCSPSLCAPPAPQPDDLPSAGVVIAISIVVSISMAYIAFVYHSSTAAGRQIRRRFGKQQPPNHF